MPQKEATLLLRIKEVGSEALDKVGGALSAIGGIATAAFGLVAAAAAKGVASYQASEEATNSLTQAMVQAGVYSKKLQQEYLDQASALQKVTTFADENIVSAQAALQMQIGELKITPELTKAVLDLAAAKKMDLASAADLVGKTIGTSTNALKRQGIEIDENASKSQKLAAVTDALNRKFGGQAEAAAQGYGGLKQLANIVDDLWESLGEQLQPTIAVMVGWLKEFAQNAQFTGSNISMLVSVIQFCAKATAYLIAGFETVGGILGTTFAAGIAAASAALKGNFGEAMNFVKQGAEQMVTVTTTAMTNLNNRIAQLDAARENQQKAQDEREKANLAATLDAKEAIRAEKHNAAAQAALERQNAQTELEIEMMGATEEQKLALQIAYLDKQISNTQNAREKQRLIEEKFGLMRKQKMMEFETAMTDYAKKQDELRTQNREKTLNTIATLQNSSNKALAALGKAAAITQIAIETPVAIARALSAFPPPFNFVAAGLVGAAMAVQAAQVSGIQLAEGGIVRARPGGVQATIGEGGQDEAVIPLDRASEFGFGGRGGVNITVYGGMMGDPASAMEFAKAVDQELLKLRRNNDSVAFDERVT